MTWFYVITNNDGATNFKLVTCGETDTSSKYWKDVIPHREDTLLESMEMFNDFLVLNERKDIYIKKNSELKKIQIKMDKLRITPSKVAKFSVNIAKDGVSRNANQIS